MPSSLTNFISSNPSTSSYPSTRPENIHNIISTVDRYNPSNLSVLEEYLTNQQCLHPEENDLHANLAILKMYILYFISVNLFEHLL